MKVSVWHGDMRKKQASGSRKTAYRKKRKYEKGTFPAQTIRGERKQKATRGRGGNVKIKILSEKQVCVTDQKTGKTEKTEVLRVVKNPANIDYNRRGVITKGALIETSLGTARITSRPGQHGILNAVLTDKEKS
ncbi:30S ribosomal protein S8e [Candidatus Bathyarchaeota archaeon]|jgi:small subunit ribosomal protein S8e|nr:30S ribosomal protein S8e [Candidatus Bathyarchaeota archaeon]